MREVTIKGRFPGMNQYVQTCRNNPYGANKLIKDSEREIIKDLQAQIKAPLVPPIFIKYTFFEPNKRRDKDNISGFFHKVFQDSLVKAELLSNDGWDYIDGFIDHFGTDKDFPRIEIKIIEEGD